MFKQLTGTMADTSWPDADTPETFPNGTPSLRRISLYTEKCTGHRGSDLYPFDLLPGAADTPVKTGISDASLDYKDDIPAGGGGRGSSKKGQPPRNFQEHHLGDNSDDRSGERSSENTAKAGASTKRASSDDDDGGGERNTLTNREVLRALDPRGDKLSYVYDDFRWDHCAEQGYDFGDAWLGGATATGVEGEEDVSSGVASRAKEEEDVSAAAGRTGSRFPKGSRSEESKVIATTWDTHSHPGWVKR